MDVLTEDALEQEITSSPASFLKFLEAQRELLHSQIGELQNVVVTQCKLTGVNPLSQEMVRLCADMQHLSPLGRNIL